MTTRPNILVLMVDQLAGTFFPDGAPAPFLHAPNLRALAARSARFTAAYCASPLCAPSRASFMSGLLPSATGTYDNAAEFPADTPTFAHHLRRAGYQTTLCGKMHFVGPDQLHGFEERLTTDIYPADFGGATVWTLARTGWPAQCPNAAQFFENLFFDVEMENQMMGLILDDGEEAEDAAETWIKANPARLDAWLANVTTLAGEPGLPAVKEALGL